MAPLPPSRRQARTAPPRNPIAPAGPGLAPRVERAILGAILAAAAFLCLWNLGAPRLWQDEAETALLGRNVLKFGMPRVWDGQNLVAQFYELDFDRHFLFQKSWLPPYLVAGSFALAGESTATARLPFALCALASVWMTWRLGRRLAGRPAVGLVAAGLLTLSLPFVLYARQCRWYGLAMVITLVLLEAEDRLERPGGWAVLGAASAALYHANYLVCVATVAGLLAARALTRGARSLADRRLAAGAALGAGLAVPHLIAFPPFGQALGATDLVALGYSVAWAAGDLNRYILPLPALGLLLAWRARPLLGESWFRRLGALLAVALVTSSLTLWGGLVDIIGFRYVINLLPVAAILTASVFCAATRERIAPLAGLVALTLGTSVPGLPLSLWPPIGRPGFVKSDLPKAFASVVSPVAGPIDAAVEHLAAHARSGEYLFTPYEALPLQFYTPLRITGMQSIAETLQKLGLSLPPYVSELHPDRLDWLLPRASWDQFLKAPPTEEILMVERQRGRTPERIDLAAPDLPWQTREYPPLRLYADDPTLPRTVLFHFPPAGPPEAPGRP